MTVNKIRQIPALVCDRRLRLLRIALVTTLTLGIPALADEHSAVETLKALRPDLTIVNVEPSPIPGVYAVEVEGGSMLYASDDGSHLIAGDMYALTETGLVNLADARRAKQRHELFTSLDVDDLVVFAPKDETKAVINVFTDVDCTFCRKLHQEMAELNAFGIEVRYLAYPRAGIGSPSYDKIVSAWCSDDPQTAITKLKLGETIPNRTCDNPVAEHYELGQAIGVSGTPALVTQDGEMIPGYVPAAELAERLGVL